MAGHALELLAGGRPRPRRAALRQLRDMDGQVLDEALVLWFDGPKSATGEDCAELHCHGGRAVVAAVLTTLAAIPGLRAAEAGEFTRRAFENGRIDLAQAEALGDLLQAETEIQRRVAQAGIGGALSSEVDRWRMEVLELSAMVEALLDFAEDDDIKSLPEAFHPRREHLRGEIGRALAMPRSERLREGVRVVLSGPPNCGKSSLFNALLGEGAAIVSAQPGTTRDVLERPVAFGGVPFVIVDTAGIREQAAEAIEAIGIEKAQQERDRADIVLWLGPEGEGPRNGVEVQSRADDPSMPAKVRPQFIVSSKTGAGLDRLVDGLMQRARKLLPAPTSSAINTRQAGLLAEAELALGMSSDDPLILAESLRVARTSFDRLLGRSGVEDMLDSLFGRFCIGK